MRYAARRDGNDLTITLALRNAGFSVWDAASAGGGIPDKLVYRALPDGRPWVCWVEVKMPSGKLRPAQEMFQSIFAPRDEFYVARDPVATVAVLTQRYQAAIRPEHAR